MRNLVIKLDCGDTHCNDCGCVPDCAAAYDCCPIHEVPLNRDKEGLRRCQECLDSERRHNIWTDYVRCPWCGEAYPEGHDDFSTTEPHHVSRLTLPPHRALYLLQMWQRFSGADENPVSVLED